MLQFERQVFISPIPIIDFAKKHKKFLNNLAEILVVFIQRFLKFYVDFTFVMIYLTM